MYKLVLSFVVFAAFIVYSVPAFNNEVIRETLYDYATGILFSQDTSNKAKIVDPPKDLQYGVDGNTVHLSWSSPFGGTEEWLKYHDGYFENSFASTGGGSGLAQRFTLTSTPATITEVRFFTTDYQLWGRPITIFILDNTGYNVLAGPYVTTGLENNWVSVPVNAYLQDNHFMVATYNDDPNGPYVAVDNSHWNSSLFFGNHTIGFSELSQLGDFKYIGSHEAKVMYAKNTDRTISEWIKPTNSVISKNMLSQSVIDPPGSAPYPASGKTLVGYNIYRDGSMINQDTLLQTIFTDADVPNGEYLYGVSAVHEEGESSKVLANITVNNQNLPAPHGLQGSINGNNVQLTWIAPEGYNEELIYDNGTSTGGYVWPGHTMSIHMSPAGPCQILKLKYLTGYEHEGGLFHSRIYDWGYDQPVDLIWFKNNLQPVNGWGELDISDQNIFVDGDFVVGFASVDTLSFLGFDANLNNGRSWDYSEYTEQWSTWEETYLIRAVVQYSDDEIEEIGYTNNVIGYNIFRNNIKINSGLIDQTNTTDNLPGWGEYKYNVAAVYGDGSSGFSNDCEIKYYYNISESDFAGIRIYPNPATDRIKISTSSVIDQLRLYSPDGRVLKTESSADDGIELDVSDLPNGVYFIHIQISGKAEMYKVLVR